MEKVTLYVRRILALLLSFSIIYFVRPHLPGSPAWWYVLLALSLLFFSFLNYRITDEKPRFMFGMNQIDTYLNKKGGFWILFKWIVIVLGFAYDLCLWIAWGVYLIFILAADILMLVKFVLYWILHALIWFVRQLFPPIVFMAKMAFHYLVKWIWWIYQVAVNNVKTSINRNFYIIALWGTVPAVFIVFLFYAISQVVGIPQLIFISAIFALVPLVWSYGEIAALRYENREKDDYFSVKFAFRNGWDAVRSVLFFLLVILVLMVGEILFNLAGWIPNLSMSFFGISMNLNMFFSLLLVFLAIIITFADCIIPTHILYHPEHENNFKSSQVLLGAVGRKFLRYLSVLPFAGFFGSLLMIIPGVLLFLSFNLTEVVKDRVMDVRISQLSAKMDSLDDVDARRVDMDLRRLNMYKEIPLMAPQYFADISDMAANVKDLKQQVVDTEEELAVTKEQNNKKIADISGAIDRAGGQGSGAAVRRVLDSLSDMRLDLEEENLAGEKELTGQIAWLKEDLKEQKSQLVQLPVLYFFMGILYSLFGGMVLAIFISYLGNVFFQLYGLREDGKPSYWVQVLNGIREKDPNQPLLGFTLLFVLLLVVVVLYLLNVLDLAWLGI